MSLKSLIALVAAIATPDTIAAVKAFARALASLKRLKGDHGEDVTPEALEVLWEAWRVEARTLGAEARAAQVDQITPQA